MQTLTLPPILTNQSTHAHSLGMCKQVCNTLQLSGSGRVLEVVVVIAVSMLVGWNTADVLAAKACFFMHTGATVCKPVCTV